MTKKERLLRTMRGLPVDRPAVCFYELNGHAQDPDDADPYNVYGDPSWRELLELARERTDKIVLCGPRFIKSGGGEHMTVEAATDAEGSVHTVRRIRAPGGELTSRSVRHIDVDTVWTTEHFIKTAGDMAAYLSLPEEEIGAINISGVLEYDRALGDTGIAAIDTGDALCAVASLFSMEDYLILATTERKLFTELLERAQKDLLIKLKMISEALPGRLYRICGSEYASRPYLPPELYDEYVTKYDAELIRLIHRSGGYARVHSHGNLAAIADSMIRMGADATDPVEPPPQGDVTLKYMRERYGDRLVLFGNIELAEIENLETDDFKRRVASALKEGTSGTGRGFVLMPSASPISRALPEKTLRHYRIMLEAAEGKL